MKSRENANSARKRDKLRGDEPHQPVFLVAWGEERLIYGVLIVPQKLNNGVGVLVLTS